MVTLKRIYTALLPFIALQAVVLAIILFFPPIALRAIQQQDSRSNKTPAPHDCDAGAVGFPSSC